MGHVQPPGEGGAFDRTVRAALRSSSVTVTIYD
jgi:hypothetical protein